MEVRREVQPIIAKNKARARTTQAYAELAAMQGAAEGNNLQVRDVTEYLEDMREYDVPYHVRFAIDCDIRCGYWYNVKCQDGVTTMEWRSDLLQRAEPRVCAWDIECTKLPLQFPNAEYDQVSAWSAAAFGQEQQPLAAKQLGVTAFGQEQQLLVRSFINSSTWDARQLGSLGQQKEMISCPAHDPCMYGLMADSVVLTECEVHDRLFYWTI
eukprot:1159279-Pelagomonas_calceolata.AAC.4